MALASNTASLEAILDTINTLPDYVDTTGTATAADIYTGKTATVNDKKLTGTNPYNAANVDPAVADALAALVEKGVDTTGAGLAELAALIGGIETGAKIVFGEITPASETTSLTITHDLGVEPKVFVIGLKNSYDGVTNGLLEAVYEETGYYNAPSAPNTQCYIEYQGTDRVKPDFISDKFVMTSTNVSVSNAKSYKFIANPYRWMAIA